MSTKTNIDTDWLKAPDLWTLVRGGKTAEAIRRNRQCLVASPIDKVGLLNAAILRGLAPENGSELLAYRRLLTAHAESVEGWTGLGLYYRRFDNIEAAQYAFERALRLAPNHVPARYHQGILDFYLGRLTKGWAGYEWRWQSKRLPGSWRNFPAPVWDGKSKTEGKVLIWGEQGLGDEIMFAGPALELAEEHQIVFESDPRLVALLRRDRPNLEVVPRSDPPAPRLSDSDIKSHLPVAAACALRRPSMQSFSASNPFLKADQVKARALRGRFTGDRCDTPVIGPVIGLSWWSHSKFYSHRKSFMLHDLAPFLTMSNVTWVDIQYGDHAKER
jgi:hypothetical protein